MDDWLFLLETLRASWRKVGCPARLTAAVSGGADSVALLRGLRALAQEEGFFLSVAHVDHGLRESAKEDALFVAALCQELDVPCRVYRVQVQGTGENAAREARYEALGQACAHFSAPVLALAHHRQDQAETVLLHLLRGSGSGGLAAMAECSQVSIGPAPVTLWRPMLALSPDGIRRALLSRGFSWREDETNLGDDYLRNYIRHQVLPVIQARLPHAQEALGRAASTLSAEHDYFSQEARRFLEKRENACLEDPVRWLRREPLFKLHPALKRYVLRAACPVGLDYKTTEGLMALSAGQKMNLPEGWTARCTAEYVHFVPPEGGKNFPFPRLTPLRSAPFQGDTGDGKRTQAMGKSVLAGCVLRFGQPGDRIWPLGASGTKSMQDYWVDKKIPQPFRRYMPLLCMGNRVVWAIGVGAGEEARIDGISDAVFLRYDGFLPLYLPER